jgi:undecaprenyl-diphosphatase
MNLLASGQPSLLPLALIAVGVGLAWLGLAHRLPALARWDAHGFQVIHSALEPYSAVFRYLWPLGKTPLAIGLLVSAYLAGWKAGGVLTLVYLLAVGLERAIKLIVRRPRPFQVLQDAEMRQPRPPRDPSHPSGDALRAWFFALSLPAIFQFPWPAALLACLLAALVSAGRIVLGVHYPLDVLGGAGLGLLAAGLALAI